jgi:acetyltransferase-like isoleucine patch superfamily enzyme
VLKRLARKVRDLIRGPAPRPILSPPDRILGLEGCSIQPTARLFVREGAGSGYLILGPRSYLGRNVELATAYGGSLYVGEDTSIQDNCVFQGDIEIGAHCLFGANAMMGTTIHRFRDNPSWLIRDQDAAMAGRAAKPADYSRPIILGDDCWIGWGAAFMPGVHVGRGAIIGANCVVTHDIGPYEIHGGVPNRMLGKRLDFTPPQRISAQDDENLPYFYAGFQLQQARLAQSRAAAGAKAAHSRATIVLAGNASGIRIAGTVLDSHQTLRLAVRVNGSEIAQPDLPAGPFVLEVKTGGQRGLVSPLLSNYTVIELIDRNNDTPDRRYNSAGRYAVMTAAIAN